MGKNITVICSAMRSYRTFRERNPASGKKAGAIRRITVRPKPGSRTRGLLVVGSHTFECALGRGGIVSVKREGDGGTPMAAMRLLRGYFRNDRAGVSRKSGLALTPIAEGSGWCDATADRNYNRPVELPYPASAERMKRDDSLYDTVIVLDWNIRPRMRRRGSAIFLHLARPGFAPTEGCVAVSPALMRRLLPRLSNRTVLRVLR